MNTGNTKAIYKDLYDKVAALFFRHDPAGIGFDDNIDEYELEVDTVLPRLERCRNVEDVTNVLYEEFVRWFDADIAGPRERYLAIAAELWPLWLDFKNPSTT